MSITLDAYKERRLVLVGFERAKDIDPTTETLPPPEPSTPDLDTRGTQPPEFAYVVGLMEGKTIKVRLRRYQLDDDARLYINSENPAFVTIKTPETGKLPNEKVMDIELYGVKGGNPNQTKLEVRIDSPSGPVIQQLIVRCFTKLTVAISPHLVAVGQKGSKDGALIGHAKPASAIQIANAIWSSCGITFDVKPVQQEIVYASEQGVIDDQEREGLFLGEVGMLLEQNWIPNTVNVYFVSKLASGTWARTCSRKNYDIFDVPSPGIVIADYMMMGFYDTIGAGLILAHELGHFLGLSHVDDKQNPAREDYWSRTMLMYPYMDSVTDRLIGMASGPDDWRAEAGYGLGRGGDLLTHKDLSTIAKDAECTIAREAVVAGPY